MSALSPDVVIRPLRSQDSAAIDDLFAGMSDQSRYARFHSAITRITATMRRYLLDLDGLHRGAFVAEVCEGGRMRAVGISRYAGTAPGQVEMAVAVADDYHRHGVGSALIAHAARMADQAGYRTMNGEILPGNDAVIALVRRASPSAVVRRVGHGLQISAPLSDLAGTA